MCVVVGLDGGGGGLVLDVSFLHSLIFIFTFIDFRFLSHFLSNIIFIPSCHCWRKNQRMPSLRASWRCGYFWIAPWFHHR